MAFIYVLSILAISNAAYGQVQLQTYTCGDIYKTNINEPSGVFTLYTETNDAFQVFCDFQRGYGYTYLSPTTTANINISSLFTDATHVMIRNIHSDLKQYEAKIEQISSLSQTPLSIQYASHAGYHDVQNPGMVPYVYIGFESERNVHIGELEGYKVNGVDVTFGNCDGNTNSYFASFFNKNNVVASDYNPTFGDMQHHWIDSSTLVPQNRRMPNLFFSFFELHFGGCGAYGTPQHLTQVTGASVGLRYDITCSNPDDVVHASKVISGTKFGGTVTYICDLGYALARGDLRRTCTETGQWTGLKPVCGVLGCASHPCHNNGLCFELEDTTYTCECLGDFVGTYCENKAV